jgi:hypothetical protein
MEYRQKSSPVAKTGLALGATALGLEVLRDGFGFLRGGRRDGHEDGGHGYGHRGCNCGRCGVCMPPHYDYRDQAVYTKAEAHKDAEIAALKDVIAIKDAQSYTDSKVERLEEKVERVTAALGEKITNVNFGLIRLDDKVECCCKELREADQRIIDYVNCTFIPEKKGLMDADRLYFRRVKPFVGIEGENCIVGEPRRRREGCGCEHGRGDFVEG